MLESEYQARLIRKLKRMFPGCIVLKNDTDYQQGFPDLTILWETMWGVLEVKVSLKARYQPNQEYYLDLLNQMSFAAMICPENEREVLGELQQTFESLRRARVS